MHQFSKKKERCPREAGLMKALPLIIVVRKQKRVVILLRARSHPLHQGEEQLQPGLETLTLFRANQGLYRRKMLKALLRSMNMLLLLVLASSRKKKNQNLMTRRVTL